ncbi:Serine/threonine-protein kinase 4-like protein A [Diplonema papillatum]|nr:Serine/threonine-protein kinase 4-like protein A [Diplonema papillatum]
MPDIEDLDWLRSHDVPQLLNELATELLKTKPKDVLFFVATWASHKQAVRAKEDPNFVQIQGNDPSVFGFPSPDAQSIQPNTGQPPLPFQQQQSLMHRTSSNASMGRRPSKLEELGGGEAASTYQTQGPRLSLSNLTNGGAAQQPSGGDATPPLISADRRNSVSPPQVLQQAGSTPGSNGLTGPGGLVEQSEVVWGRPSPQELAVRHTVPEGRFNLQSVIGEGHYGKVYHAVREDDGLPVAVKKVTIDGHWVEQEVQNMACCECDWAVKLLESCYSPTEDLLWIVMEMLGASIATVADAAGPRAFTEPIIAEITRQVLNGLHELHTRQRVHLDIKPANLLVTRDGRQIKIADFGTMQTIGDDCIQLGDFAFMSPEVAYSAGKYIAQSDIWSVGISSLYLADGEAPLWREKPELLMFVHRETCMKPALWEPLRWSVGFSDVLSHCFLKDAQQRPTAKALLDSEWIKHNASGVLVLPPAVLTSHENGFA